MATVGGGGKDGPWTPAVTQQSPPTETRSRKKKDKKSGRRRRSRRRRQEGSQDSSSKISSGKLDASSSGKLDASDFSKRSGASFRGAPKKKGHVAGSDVSRLSKRSVECENEGRVEEVLERARRTHKSPRVGFVQLLCFALLFGTLFLLALFVKKRIGLEPFKRCTSEGCLHHAQMLLAALNMSVDPCDDFHAFVCGSWERRLTEGPANAAPDFRIQLIYDAVDSGLDKPQMNRLVLSLLRMLNFHSKDTEVMDECYAKGNKDIHTMRVCFTDTTGISVNGVCNKEGIDKYVNSRCGSCSRIFPRAYHGPCRLQLLQEDGRVGRVFKLSRFQDASQGVQDATRDTIKMFNSLFLPSLYISPMEKHPKSKVS
ncbi:uncharacterized protein LOC125756112 [Rhipicephalus sanguineus]|uniref:uncharacterized protein LOC125756112 n=1 Tax=Rhipicephalus sanguineus TaxID=34632 RepID=UPI001895AC90|nr:uncharacterized protein LOC125756112 [Rhipicephalus sanguineus]